MNIITQKNEHGNIDTSLAYFLKFKLNKDIRILDIGCNYGSLIYNLYKIGYKDVYGIDVDKKRLNMGKNKYKMVSNKMFLYSGKRIPFKDNYFDVVLMFDVMEHIPNLRKYLKNEVYRVLKNKGILIFQTPNKYTNILWEIIKKKSINKWKEDHFSLQTKSSLRKKLLSVNFNQIIIEKNEIMTPHNINKVREKLGLFGIFLLKIFKKMPLSIYPNFWGSCKK